MEQQQKILTFWDHLEELRHVLFGTIKYFV